MFLENHNYKVGTEEKISISSDQIAKIIKLTAYERTYKVKDKAKKVVGLFGLASLLNHDKEPNLRMYNYGGQEVFYETKRAIKKGEELTFTYYSD